MKTRIKMLNHRLSLQIDTCLLCAGLFPVFWGNCPLVLKALLLSIICPDIYKTEKTHTTFFTVVQIKQMKFNLLLALYFLLYTTIQTGRLIIWSDTSDNMLLFLLLEFQHLIITPKTTILPYFSRSSFEFFKSLNYLSNVPIMKTEHNTIFSTKCHYVV